MTGRLGLLALLAISVAVCRADPVTYAPPAEAAEGQLPDVDEYDCLRFPPAAVLEHGVAFQGAHLAWLEARMAYSQDARHSLYEYREDFGWRREVYDAALFAARQGPGGTRDGSACRCALRELRGLIGARAYHRGELPCCVEWRQFSRAD